MTESITVPRRFNGPMDSGQGGYSAGLFARLVSGVAQVSLRRPVPLDAPLEVIRHNDEWASVLARDALVAEVRTTDALHIEPPAPVSVAEARRAATRYRGLVDGIFSRCFVCGRARKDALGVFPGRVDGRDLVASPWTPPAWTADPYSHVRTELIWAALDCPTYFALYSDGHAPLSVLGRFTATSLGPVNAAEEHIVIGWPIEIAGRKHHAGAALLSRTGTALAVGRALLIAPRPD